MIVSRHQFGYLSFFAILALSSCETIYYVPTNQNVLKFKEKGDAHLAIGADENFKYSTVGYAITKNVAILSEFKSISDNGSSTELHRNRTFLWDNELIVYKKYPNYFIPAVNFGYGYGQINRNSQDYKLDVSRQFIQPSIGFSNDYFDFALSTRFSRVNYQLLQLKDPPIGSNRTFEEYHNLKDVGKKDFYFLEPAITIGVGYKFIKLRFQKIAVHKLSSSDLKYESSSATLTLNLTFNVKRIRKPKN